MMRFRLQSAMEYLMTYGWAVLLIAVVLVGLYELGLFNFSNFSPTAPPGSCKVDRPNGPGTVYFVSLQGTCNNALPQYVAVFNGKTANVLLNNIQANIQPGAFDTVTFWMYSENGAGVPFAFSQNAIGFSTTCFGFNVGTGGSTSGVSSSTLQNSWVFVTAVIYNGAWSTSSDLLYINGIKQNFATPCNKYKSATGASSLALIGAAAQKNSGFNGLITNVQIYNTSLSSNQIKDLYQEGIGGEPVSVTNLVTWVQLNGDAKDYSGNYGAWVSTNVIFKGSWSTTYVPP